jgi:hypothetical protein
MIGVSGVVHAQDAAAGFAVLHLCVFTRIIDVTLDARNVVGRQSTSDRHPCAAERLALRHFDVQK